MKIRMIRDKRGQFIVIAALLIALMIISATTVMFSAGTYFKHEQWEEYLIVIDGVKAGTANVLKLSLANYTQTSNGSVLKTNLDSWRDAVKNAYSGFGAILGYSLANGSYSAYGMNPINYYLGLNRTWNKPISFSVANATTNLNITSVGLTGYRFTSVVFLKMNITDYALWYSDTNQVGVRVVMYAEGPTMLTNLQKGNFLLFQVNDVDKTQNSTLSRYYESSGHPIKKPTYPALNAYVYELRYSASSKPSSSVNVVVTVRDSRGIQVTGAFNIPADRIIDY